jgi:hypothetical protein
MSVTACQLLLAKRVRGQFFLSRFVRGLFCRCRGWLGAALRLPSRCGRTLLRLRPESAIRVVAPRRSHEAAPPSPQRGSRVRRPRAPERLATRGTGGFEPPSQSALGPARKAEGAASRHGLWVGFANGRVVVRTAPRAVGAMAPKRAGTERPDRRVETLAATERLMRGRGTARIRAATGTARSHAKTGRSCGLDGRSERPLLARGARGKPLGSDKEKAGRAPAWQNKAVRE